ncbi:MAG: DUF5666 domain-containing protein [Candidatus Electronema sp. V4]|uniref:DUF5666 domain-containing protein n=1 Tax=Candidatus Electronema sp. V4 TaxID=3454756 RepID=UPI00405569A7
MKRAITLLAIAVTLSAAASAQASRHEYGEYGEYGRGYSRGYGYGGGYESRTKFYGTIDAMPSSGIWMVSGRQVAISPGTRIKEKYGRVAPGAYVEVEGYHSNGGFTAYEIEVKGGSGGYRYR